MRSSEVFDRVCLTRPGILAEFQGRFSAVPAPSRTWGRGVIMQPTPRGSGVWVSDGKKPEPGVTQPIFETSPDGRHYCCRSVSSGGPTTTSTLAKIVCLAAGAYAPATIMSPSTEDFASAISRRARSCFCFYPHPAAGDCGLYNYTPVPRCG